jgi:hypothetical protein
MDFRHAPRASAMNGQERPMVPEEDSNTSSNPLLLLVKQDEVFKKAPKKAPKTSPVPLWVILRPSDLALQEMPADWRRAQ